MCDTHRKSLLLMKTNKQLNKIFITQVVAFTVAILLISSFLFYRLSIRHLEERVTADYRAELKILAEETNHKVLLAEENVKALSSRTMIRRELYKYHIGDITLKKLREYTQAKYVDGASVYGDILVAERKDLQGAMVARFSRGDMSIPEGFEDKDLSFIKTASGCNLLIRNRIVHEGSDIGYDTALFNFDSVFEGKGKHIKTIELTPSAESVPSSGPSASAGPAASPFSDGERPDGACTAEEYTNGEQPDGDRLGGKHQTYGLSVPVGDTGWFLKSTLNREVLLNERGKIIKTVLLLSVLLIAAVLVVSYFTILRLSLRLLRERDEINTRLNESLREKEYLLKELHHRVKNNLTLISSFLHLQSSETDNQELIDRNRVLESRINAVSLVHQKLQVGDGSMDVELGAYMEDLGSIIIRSNGDLKIGFIVRRETEIFLPVKQVIPVGLILSELIINSIKHALGDDGLHIRLDIEKEQESDSLVLRFNDDGRPFPEDFDIKHTGTMGFLIIRNLVQQLGGSIDQDLSSGKEIRMVFPHAAVSADQNYS